MPSSDLLHASVRRRLGGLRTSLRGRLFFEGLAWLVLATVAAVLATLGLDFWLHLDRDLRMGLTSAAAAGLLYIVWRQVVRPLQVPMDVKAMALLVEKRFGRLADRLITAVEFSARPPQQWEGVSSAMIELAGAQANEMAQALDFRQVVERPRMRRLGLAALCGLMLLAGFSIWQKPVMGLWFQRNIAFAEIDWPQNTYLKVLGGPHFRVVRGDDLEIFVDAEGDSNDIQVLLHAEYASGEKMEVRMEPLPASPRRLTKKFPTVVESFNFYVTGGDDELDKRSKHSVVVVDPPSLRQVAFRVDHRAYMQRPSDPLDQSAVIIPVTPGSTLHIEGTANKDLTAGRLVLDDQEKTAVPLRIVETTSEKGGKGPRGVRGDLYLPPLNVATSRTLKVILTGADGTVNRRGQQFVVQVQPDLAPSVEIKKRGVESVLTPKAYFPARLLVKDDYGVSGASLAVTCKNHPRADLPVDSNKLPVEREFALEQIVDIQSYAFNPGDVIQVFAEVRDNMPEDFLSPPTDKFPGGAPGPNLSASGQLEFRIVKPEELLESLVQRQKELHVEFLEFLVVQASSMGKTLQALQDAQAGQAGESAKALTGDASKLSVAVGAECAKAAETLAGILEEYEYNRMILPEEERYVEAKETIRLLKEVAKPISEVTAELADCSRLSDAPAVAAKLDPVAAKQADISESMKKIEAKMYKFQSIQEVERQLSTLIDQAKTTEKEIEKENRRPTEGLFQPTTKPTTTSAPASGEGR